MAKKWIGTNMTTRQHPLKESTESWILKDPACRKIASKQSALTPWAVVQENYSKLQQKKPILQLPGRRGSLQEVKIRSALEFSRSRCKADGSETCHMPRDPTPPVFKYRGSREMTFIVVKFTCKSELCKKINYVKVNSLVSLVRSQCHTAICSCFANITITPQLNN